MKFWYLDIFGISFVINKSDNFEQIPMDSEIDPAISENKLFIIVYIILIMRITTETKGDT